MALSATLRQQLRLFLGYPSVGLQVNRILENALDAVDAKNSPELFAMIDAEMGEVLAIDAQLATARGKLRFKRVEDVEFNLVGAEIAQLKASALFHVQRLGTLLSVPIAQNPFSASTGSNAMRWG